VSEVAWAIMVATSEAQRSCREKTNGRALGAAGIAFAGFGGNIAQAPQVGRRPQTANCGAFQGVFFGATGTHPFVRTSLLLFTVARLVLQNSCPTQTAPIARSRHDRSA
jgi:hypothetical protein